MFLETGRTVSPSQNAPLITTLCGQFPAGVSEHFVLTGIPNPRPKEQGTVYRSRMADLETLRTEGRVYASVSVHPEYRPQAERLDNFPALEALFAGRDDRGELLFERKPRSWNFLRKMIHLPRRLPKRA